MTPDSPMTTGDLNRRSPMVAGALAGAVGVIAVMPFFYPLGRVFDPTLGGDSPSGLLTEVVLGFIGGIVLSPVAGLLGAAVGLMLNGRRIGPATSLLLIVLASALAAGLWIALNGGSLTKDTQESLQWVATLGAFAGAIAVLAYTLARRALVSKLPTPGARRG